MNKQKQMEALAKIEGVYLDCPKGGTIEHEDGKFEPVPCDYLNSRDAVQRVIDCLSRDQLREYHNNLCSRQNKDWEQVIRATPAQKCEAVLKVLGLWEEYLEYDSGPFNGVKGD